MAGRRVISARTMRQMPGEIKGVGKKQACHAFCSLPAQARPRQGPHPMTEAQYGQHRIGLLLVAGAAMAWSTSGLFVRNIWADLMTLLFWRGIFSGAAVFALFLYLERGRSLAILRAFGWPAFAVALLSAAGMITGIGALLVRRPDVDLASRPAALHRLRHRAERGGTGALHLRVRSAYRRRHRDGSPVHAHLVGVPPQADGCGGTHRPTPGPWRSGQTGSSGPHPSSAGTLWPRSSHRSSGRRAAP